MVKRTSLVVAAALGVGLLGSFAVAQPAAERKPAPATRPGGLEVPKPAPAAKFLGAALTGPNYTVRPTTRSDGIMRLFEVDTPYGAFQFDGVEFTRMRLRELQATAALEKMSQSDAWVKSFGRTAIAPLKLGVDFVVNPFDTVGRSVTGIHNMFDRAGASIAGQRSNRDSLADSLLGVSDAQRQLAFELGIDPYSDFPPLAQRLRQIAGAMAGGQLTVKAGLAAVTGGVGIGISAASNVESAKDTLRDKTAAQVIIEVRGILISLQIAEDLINRLVENRNYTPADLLIMSRALAQISAQNTAVYLDVAADAQTRGTAYFHRRRAELLAQRNAELGGLAAFAPVAGHAVNVTRDGRAVAAFPLDDLAWTELPRRTFQAANAELRGRGAVFATTGQVTPMAAAEIKKLGWKIVQLKPVR
jgi:hypothetical protein